MDNTAKPEEKESIPISNHESHSSEIGEPESSGDEIENSPIHLEPKNISPPVQESPETNERPDSTKAPPSEASIPTVSQKTNKTDNKENEKNNQSSESSEAEETEEKKQEIEIKPVRLIANVLHTQYDVVKEVLKDKFGCKLSIEEEGEWDILWADTGVTSTMVAALKPYQKINHYHGMSCLARKNHLGRNLMRLRKVLPEDYNFFPPTWLLPTDWNEFKTQFTGKKGEVFILKPEALSQGKGIFLVTSPEGIDLDQKYVAQRYLGNVYTIEGLKFDLRIYALVYGCDPLRIYLYKEGLCRLATEQYVPPEGENINNLYVHLTNYAINKNNDKFVFNTDPEKTDVGHKRNLAFVWKYIDEHGGDSKKLREEIKECIIKTLCAVQPLLSHSYRSCQPYDNNNNKCFEILGFDILLDSKLKPYLLEVNHSPSFTTDTPFDHKIKFSLLTDVLNIVKFDQLKRPKYYKKQEDKKLKVPLKEKAQKTTKEELIEIRKKKMAKRDKWELEHSGDFTRIYPELELGIDPAMGSSKYDKYIVAAQGVWDEFTGAKKRKELIKKKADVVEKQQKKRKNLLSMKSTYTGPINRKPLYYIKEQNVPKCRKNSENIDILPDDPTVNEYLKEPLIRKLVIDRISGDAPEELKDQEMAEIIDTIAIKLMDQYKTPLAVMEQFENLTKPREAKADKIRKKALGPGAFIKPTTITFDADQMLPPPAAVQSASKKPPLPGSSGDIHKLWRWKKT